MNKKILAIVGMTGSGKSIASDFFTHKSFIFLRFGQITLDIVKEKGLSGEAAEKQIRENIRKEHGMAAYAILNTPKIDQLLKQNKNVVIDGLYSWSEYKMLKETYKENIIVLGIYASPETRYQRLEERAKQFKDDEKLRWRSFTLDESKSRDVSEIENIEKGGPIAMADYTIVNEGSLDNFNKKLEQIYKEINESKN